MTKLDFGQVDTSVTHNGAEYSAELGLIESTHLGLEDHNIFSMNLNFKFPGSGQGTGHYALSRYDKDRDARVGSAYGMDLIMRVCEVADRRQWENLKGVNLFVLREKTGYGKIAGLANPFTMEVLIFNDHYNDWITKYGSTNN